MGQVLALDFDGVINSYDSGWFKENPLYLPDHAVPGTFAFIQEAQHHFDVVVHSSRLRYPYATKTLAQWCMQEAVEQGLSYKDAFRLVADLEFSIEKPPAHVTIDDRSICFDGSWAGMLEKIIAFKPWNKRGTLIETEQPRVHPLTGSDLGEILAVASSVAVVFSITELEAAAHEINDVLGIE